MRPPAGPMTDGRRRSPLDGRLPWALPGGAVSLTELRFAEQIGIRARPPVPAYLAGVPLPLELNRVASMRELRTLWLGPANGWSRRRLVLRPICWGGSLALSPAGTPS
jgi:hypothetical protein